MTIRGLVLDSNMHLLESSKFEFFLTGSRFFGTEYEGSDYDFYVQDSKEIRQWLLANGYRGCSANYDITTRYADFNLAIVYAKHNIHIQVQKDVSMKHKAQKLMYVFRFLWENLPKDSTQRRNYWNACYKVLGELEGIDKK